MMHTIGMVAGSFDPITKGHEWLIHEAANLVDELYVVVGNNPSKQYWFSEEQRVELVENAVADLKLANPAKIILLENQLLIQCAMKHNVTHLVRGIRDMNDFNYENQMARVNQKIAPAVRTVYLGAPSELFEVSSSVVKSLVGVEDWPKIVGKYVHPSVVKALKGKLKK